MEEFMQSKLNYTLAILVILGLLLAACQPAAPAAPAEAPAADAALIRRGSLPLDTRRESRSFSHRLIPTA